jgi:Subtilase family/Fervidolysin N-terminal prodomain
MAPSCLGTSRVPSALLLILLGAFAARGQDPLASWNLRPAGSVKLEAGAGYIPGEILVGLREKTDREQVLETAARSDHWLLGEIPRLRILKLSCASGSEEQAVKALRTVAGIRFAERNAIGQEAGLDALDDPCVPDQWEFKNDGSNGGVVGADIGLEAAWSITRGSPSTIVAFLDSGIEFDHPEFPGCLLAGHDFYFGDDDPTSHYYHGIFVAGLIAAQANNGYAGTGMDQACKLLPVQVLSGSIGDEFALEQGIDFAAAAGARVINMSLQGYPSDQGLKDALHAAREAGCILISAAGNHGNGYADKSWPGASPDTISVGCTDHADVKASFSATGNALDFVAPGKFVVSTDSVVTVPDCASDSGTSFACPLVVGTTSLMLSLRPDLTQDEVYALLAAGARDQVGPLGEDLPGWDTKYGYGRIDAGDSLRILSRLLEGEGAQGVPASVNAAKGGHQLIVTRVDPALRGSPWLTLGSVGGSSPGTHFQHLAVPLNADHYFLDTVAGAGGLLDPPFGIVPDDGVILQCVNVPGNWHPTSATLHLSHALIVLHSPPVVSNAVELSIDP